MNYLKVKKLLPFFVFIVSVISVFPDFRSILLIPQKTELSEKVQAHSTFTATSGQLIVGTEVAVSATNEGSWRSTLANDNHFWQVARTATNPSLNMQLAFDDVQLWGANNLIVTISDSNISTATAYNHQICDWVNSTGVSNAADAQCTGGGWRNLHQRNVNFTDTTERLRNYEIYDGYFWDRSAPSPGTVISTPLTNFINTSANNRVLIRAYSTVNTGTVNFRIDLAQIEVAIDSVYEPADFVKNSAGTTTNFITDLVGNSASTGLSGSDNADFNIPQSAGNVPIDVHFVFKDVRTYTGMNTILISNEFAVNNVGLTFSFYLRNFNSDTWTQISTPFTAASTSDWQYELSFNDATINGFELSEHISNAGEVWYRILTNAPSTARTLQMDRLYMMTGSVNTNSSLCEISFGTGSSTDCVNTRSIFETTTATSINPTWQATAVLEYPEDPFYAADNDASVDNEYATSQNLSFPVTLDDNMSVRAIHYAVKYRSNSAAQTADLQVRDYASIGANAGWVATPGSDTNAATTYSWFDTWNLLPYIASPSNSIDTINNLMNLRLRTSAGSTTDPGTRDWSFAMMSIRWIDETNHVSRLTRFTPTGSELRTGSEVATSVTNNGSWKGTLGNDAKYWITQRDSTQGLDKLISFDGVELYNANKLIIHVEDSNVTTAQAYNHQICDWVSSTGVNHSTDSDCTGGGWRIINNVSNVNLTNTSDTARIYDIYNGYFSSTDVSPGTVYDTPLSNFIEPTNKRLLFRTFSNVGSTVQHRIDFVQIEAAVDPIYDPVNMVKINSYSGSNTGFLSQIRGTQSADNLRFVLTNNATNNLDVYFTFENIKTFIGANTFLIRHEMSVSNAALTVNYGIWNFADSEWEQIASPNLAASTTERVYSYSKSGISDFNDYISSGQTRIRIWTTADNTFTLTTDRLYLMLGTTNADNSRCEITYGVGTETDCSKTRDISNYDNDNTTPSSDTWEISNELEYQENYFAFDNDGSVDEETAVAANVDFPIELTSGTVLSAIHYAVRLRSNSTTQTLRASIRDYTGDIAALGGWADTSYTNNTTSYSYGDSRTTFLNATPRAYINTASNTMNMRIRTSVSSDTTPTETSNIDFMMMSIRWVNIEMEDGTLNVDIVDSNGDSVASPSLEFTPIDSSFECQESSAIFGVISEKIRVSNTTNNSGWSLSIAADGGITDSWSTGGLDEYDFNDSGGSPPGCSDGGDADIIAGQLVFNFDNTVITPQGGCTTTGINIGSNSAFSQSSVDSIEIVSASGSSNTNCYWDISGIGLTQKIPKEQGFGNYSIPMTLTIVAN